MVQSCSDEVKSLRSSSGLGGLSIQTKSRRPIKMYLPEVVVMVTTSHNKTRLTIVELGAVPSLMR